MCNEVLIPGKWLVERKLKYVNDYSASVLIIVLLFLKPLLSYRCSGLKGFAKVLFPSHMADTR